MLPERPLVKPSAAGAKDGCLYCPLLPWCKDFPALAGDYQRDPETIRNRFREGHQIRNRRIQEPYKPVDVLFIGEVPNGTEDRTGEAFTGAPGKLLRGYVKKIKNIRRSYACTYIVRCATPNGRSPNNTEIKSCQPALLCEIRKRKPKLIVTLGGPALKAVTGLTGINLLNGKVVQATLPGVTIPVVACMTPAYVLRFDHEEERFVDALQVASDVLKGTHEVKKGLGKVTVINDIDEAIRAVTELRTCGKKFAFDTETGSLSWWETKFPRILCFSFANDEDHGIVIPWDHAESPWKRDCQSQAAKRDCLSQALRDLFTSDVPKVAQNGKFDAKMIHAELGVWVKAYQDTILRHYVLDERQGTHGLDVLAREFTGCGGYDQPLEDYKDEHPEADPSKEGSYANIPAEVLFPYAAIDAYITLRVDNALLANQDYQDNPKFRNLAENFLPKLSATLARMEYRGAKIDTDRAAVVAKDVDNTLDRLAAELRKFPHVRQYEVDRLVAERAKKKTDKGKAKVVFRFNPGSDKQVQTILFEYMKESPTELTDAGFTRLSARFDRRVKRNPLLKFDEVVAEAARHKEWSLFSVKSDVMHTYIRSGNSFAKTLLDYRDAHVLRGSFLTALLTKCDQDNVIHSNFNPAGTVTGRLSSSGPNHQAMPNKDGGRIKGCFISRFDDGVILALDYSQVELRFAAGVYNEESMLKVYRENGDIHTQTAMDISQLDKEQYGKLDPKDKKTWRTRAKRVSFGSLYGSGPPGIQNTLRKDGVFMELSECEEMLKNYFDAKPALKNGIKLLNERTINLGYVESFTGRRRRVPEVRSVNRELVARALRQSVNYGIQSGASDLTLASLVIIDRELRKRRLRSCLTITVHDSIVIDCPIDEMLEVAESVKDIMENIHVYGKTLLKGADWSWRRCDILADCEVGLSWGYQVPFDPAVIKADVASDKPLFEDKDGKRMLARNPTTMAELCEAMVWKSP